jgi:hypothetical protein
MILGWLFFPVAIKNNICLLSIIDYFFFQLQLSSLQKIILRLQIKKYLQNLT